MKKSVQGTFENYPLRASYGVKNNSHDLLAFNGNHSDLPSNLSGLTDRPPGHLISGERWWPSVGFTPLGDWWALWWTVPDDDAVRAGMVKSEVALWPLDMVPQIKDLAAVMQTLNGGNRIVPPSQGMLIATASALLSSPSDTPVVTDLDAWPGLLVALWERLWPEARKHFSARVAVMPLSNGRSIGQPTLLAIGQGQENKWPSTAIIKVSTITESASSAVNWLIGIDDSVITELLNECPLASTSFSDLNRLGRIADGLVTLRQGSDLQVAIRTWRALVVMAPKAVVATKQKEELLRIISRELPNVTLQSVRSLRNIKEENLLSSSVPKLELKNWILEHLPGMDFDLALPLLVDFSENEAEQWWTDSVKNALTFGLNATEKQFSTLFFFWLCHAKNSTALSNLLDNHSKIEISFLEIAERSMLNKEQLSTLRHNCQSMGWSRLHGWALFHSSTAKDALLMQLEFTSEPELGLKILVEKIPSQKLIVAAVEVNDSRLFTLVAHRTVANPTLLVSLDLSIAGWRSLWTQHVLAGGEAWPTNVEKKKEIDKFLNAAYSENYSSGVIKRLAKDFAEPALHFSERARLWEKLHAEDKIELLNETAAAFLEFVMQAIPMDPPEQILREAIFNIADKRILSARTIGLLLNWDLKFHEERALRWITRIEDWNEGEQGLGRLVLSRRWSKIADDLLQRYKLKKNNSIFVVLSECSSLLGFFDRLTIKENTANDLTSNSSLEDSDELVRYVADLGAKYEPLRLDVIWQRAGGQLHQLEQNGTPKDKWFLAIKKADSGTLQNGLIGLVKELKEELPFNSEICRVYDFLNKK
jgi:hypothetical protein